MNHRRGLNQRDKCEEKRLKSVLHSFIQQDTHTERQREREMLQVYIYS